MDVDLKFIKELNGEWFVDLPSWEGERWELEMVAGADDMLNILSEGLDEIELYLSTEGTLSNFQGVLELEEQPHFIENGAFYTFTSTDGLFSMKIWLCHVAHFVFNEYPKQIFISKSN